ncbi:MAG: xylose isomerase [Kluyvera cryocrescens]|nr:xylose isomerase [Kluyvera cryocrescens]
MEFSMQTYFDQLDRVRYEGPKSTNPLAFRHYNPDELVLGKRMEDHLRFAACYWHTFCWNGADMFGVGSFDRPWQQPGDALEMAKRKADVAFEFFHKLNVPYYCFHDVDVSPEGASLKEYSNNFARMVEVLAEKQQQSGVKLLWGTANCFTNPRYGAGAATNPDPEVFSWAATQVVTAMNATHQLGGENYVLWGGREGYETLLNTDLRQEREQIGRFMQLVVEHKHKIGFKGTLLIEPKPQEPTKHQYDYDASTVYGFLKQFGLEKEIKLNIEANHATLAGHSFHHEIATAIALGLFGSLSVSADDKQPFRHFAELGLTYHAPFDRTRDKLNLKASYLRLNDHQLEFQRQARIAAGGDAKLGQRDVYALETNAHIALTPHIALEPSVQYIFNPDNYYNPGARELSGDGFVVGLQLMVDMGSLLGL